MANNPLNLNGIDFVEFSSDSPSTLHQIFIDFGFSKIAKHGEKNFDLYSQNDITFFTNYEHGSFGDQFQKKHGPSISAMGWRVQNANHAHKEALSRGAKNYPNGDYSYVDGRPVPAIFGIGDSLIYFIEPDESRGFTYSRFGFEKLQDPILVRQKGFLTIDHLTNNVYKGTMNEWATFYKDIFGFEEVRYFDIKGNYFGGICHASTALSVGQSVWIRLDEERGHLFDATFVLGSSAQSMEVA